MTAAMLRVRRIFVRLLVLMGAGWTAAPGAAYAARVAVVLSDDSGPYQEVYQVIRAHLDDSGHEVARVDAVAAAAGGLGDARIAVAVGVRAAEALDGLAVHPPVLAVLVPRTWYLKTARVRAGDSRRHSAIFLDQPFDRQAQLIRLAFPEARRVGVLLSAEQEGQATEIEDALRPYRLTLVQGTVGPDERIIMPLETVLADADLLLAVPDPLVFNRNTAQSLFLTSYRYRDPVIGYSRSLTRAGALVSLHSSPAQIGRQAAEWIASALQATPVRLPAPAYPAYFSVSVNDQVARSLGFPVPQAAELEKRLGGED